MEREKYSSYAFKFHKTLKSFKFTYFFLICISCRFTFFSKCIIVCYLHSDDFLNVTWYQILISQASFISIKTTFLVIAARCKMCTYKYSRQCTAFTDHFVSLHPLPTILASLFLSPWLSFFQLSEIQFGETGHQSLIMIESARQTTEGQAK